MALSAKFCWSKVSIHASAREATIELANRAMEHQRVSIHASAREATSTTGCAAL